MEINVLEGDITRTRERVDAIVTCINPAGAWFGGVDGAIQRVAGSTYHAQAAQILDKRGLYDGQVIIARGKSAHRGNFGDVIFVVDALEHPVGELVRLALEAARNSGYRRVAFPAMRTGVMLGEFAGEPDARTTVRAVCTALREFMHENNPLNLTVYLVIYSDPTIQKMFAEQVRQLRG